MEFDLIERIRQRVASRGDVVLGIGDDAALLQLPAGMQLVVAMVKRALLEGPCQQVEAAA